MAHSCDGSVRADPSSQVRRRACHCIAQICSNVVEGASGESSWGITVFPVCFEAWKSPDPQHKCVAHACRVRPWFHYVCHVCRLVGMFLLSKVLEFSPDEVRAGLCYVALNSVLL